jgi:CheY-like chemotaxis protein
LEKKKILIVDDEPSVRLTVKKALERYYVVIEAADGKQAIDMACNDIPDLILMDIMMPKVDGYTTLSEIKSNPDTNFIPVFMLSGIGLELNKKLADSFGASGYITKPFVIDELLRQIRQILGQ